MTERPWLQALCIGTLVMLIGASLRLLEWPQWTVDALWFGSEPLLPSADVYAWVAGATGNGRLAGWPMARMIGWLSIVTGQPHAVVAFWLPCLLAGIPGAVVAWLCWQRGQWGAGLGAGAFVAGSLGYLARTRLGHGDTDLFALATATGFAAVWAVAMEALISCRGNQIALGLRGSSYLMGGFVIAGIGLMIYPSGYPVLLVVAMVGIAWLLVAGRLKISAVALAACVGVLWTLHFGFPGLIAAMLLVGLINRWSQHWKAGNLALITLVTVAIIVFFQADHLSSVSQSITAYMGWGLAPPPVSDWQLPRVDDSIQETIRPIWGEWVQRVGSHWLFLVSGLVGFVFALRRWPSLVTFTPMLGLGLASYTLGNRFAMYAAPALGLGLGLGLALLLERMKPRPAYGVVAHVGLAALIVGVIGWQALKPEPAPMLVEDHARALSELADLEHDRGRVWAWWDAGYSAQHFTRLPTLADGGNASRQRIYMLGQVFGANTPEKVAGLMQLAASERLQAMVENGDWREASYLTEPMVSLISDSAEAAQAVLDNLAELGIQNLDSSLPDEFLVVSWRTLTQAQWVDHYGRWQLTDGEQGYGQIARIRPPVELDEVRGLLQTADGVVRLASMDIVAAGEHYHREWQNPSGAHAVINNDRGEGFLMDADLLGMMAVQMLLGEPARFNKHFELVIDRFPEARIYRLR